MENQIAYVNWHQENFTDITKTKKNILKWYIIKKNKGKFIYISKKLKLKFIPFKLAKLIVELNQVSH